MARDDFYASAFGRVYSAYMEHPRLSRLIALAAWGGDSKRYYESMAAIGEAPAGSTVLDCPCGACPAFRGLAPDAPVRYLAVDRSPSMLARARKRAAVRGLAKVEFAAADATAIPLADASVNTYLSLWGLHCFDDPAGAVAEAARVLEPDGRLVGASFVRGREGFRQRHFIRPHVGDFGPIGTEAEIESWLDSTGFELSSAQRSGPMLFFEARAG